MIREKAIKKIFVSTLSLFIILFSYVLINMKNTYSKPVIKMVNMNTNFYVYLLDNYNRLVRYDIFITEDSESKIIKSIFNFLKSDMIPNGLKNPVRNDLKLNNVKIKNDVLNLYLSDYPNINEIESISYSLFDVGDFKEIKYFVNNKLFTSINKKYGINKRYLINNRNNIISTTVFYNESINNKNYFVPVTKYINSDKNKIDIIIESLTSSYIYENNLMSTIMEESINSYRFDDNILFIDFNKKLNKKDLKGLSLSVFYNYDIDNIIYTNKNKIIDKVKR